IWNNKPHSHKNMKLELDANLAVTRNNSIALGYDFEHILRHCEGTWIECENSTASTESTLRAEWRSKLTDELNSPIGYATSQRHSNYDPNAWLALVPLANTIPGAPVVGATTSVYGYLQQTGLTGWGPIAGYPTTPLTGNAAIFSPNNNIIP